MELDLRYGKNGIVAWHEQTCEQKGVDGSGLLDELRCGRCAMNTEVMTVERIEIQASKQQQSVCRCTEICRVMHIGRTKIACCRADGDGIVLMA